MLSSRLRFWCRRSNVLRRSSVGSKDVVRRAAPSASGQPHAPQFDIVNRGSTAVPCSPACSRSQTEAEERTMTRLTTPRLSFPGLGLFALGTLGTLAACDGQAAESSSEDVAAVAVSGGGVTVDVVTTQTWDGGFNGAVRIITPPSRAPSPR